jgi:hypothetical protein
VTALPPDLVADGFTVPTSLAFDEAGMYVAKAGPAALGEARSGGLGLAPRPGGEHVLLDTGLSPP